LQGSNAGKEIKIPTPQCVIGREGREKGVDLQINNDAISGKHCAIVASKDKVVVCDFNSRNGTFVNEAPVIGEAGLLNGDILKVAHLQFEIIIIDHEGGGAGGSVRGGTSPPFFGPKLANP